jgi:hypothetical protein
MPGKDLNEFIAWLKANPNKASLGIYGVAGRLLSAFFQKDTGTKITLVPYRGVPIQDLMASQIDLSFDSPVSLPQVRAGSLKAYAVTSDARLVLAPDIPTFAEMGLPALSYSNWAGFSRPRARRRTSSVSLMRRPLRHWPIWRCARGSSILGSRFSRAINRRRRRSARSSEPMPRNGGRSSRSWGSRRNEKALSGQRSIVPVPRVDALLQRIMFFRPATGVGQQPPPSMKLGGDRTCSDSGRQRARSQLASARVDASA